MSKSFRAEVYPAEGSGVAEKATPRSAAGLFKATGKKAKPRAVRDPVTGEYSKTDAPPPLDPNGFHPTPPEPTLALLHAEGARLRQFPEIWEPAAGDGAMARDIRSAGWITIETDLVDRGCGAFIRDFYDFDRPIAPCIVTNPPFAEVGWGTGQARWVTHALDRLDVEYMALLLPLGWCAAGGLAGVWHRHKPARVYVCRWRIDFSGMGAAPQANAWYVWDRQHTGAEPELRMLDRVDPRQATLFPEATL